MRVWVISESAYATLGATRWAVTWWTLKASARRKNRDDVNFDTDLYENLAAYGSREVAVSRAGRLAAGSFFGTAQIKHQRLTRVAGADADWEDVDGTIEEVSA